MKLNNLIKINLNTLQQTSFPIHCPFSGESPDRYDGKNPEKYTTTLKQKYHTRIPFSLPFKIMPTREKIIISSCSNSVPHLFVNQVCEVMTLNCNLVPYNQRKKFMSKNKLNTSRKLRHISCKIMSKVPQIFYPISYQFLFNLNLIALTKLGTIAIC